VSSFTDTNEWQNHTSFPNREMPWHDAGCQIALECACQENREELGLKYKGMYWLMGKRSTGALQTDTEARVDLWHPAMGMHETEKHRHNTETSKQSKYSET
jgi:hypothetical protein